MSESLLYVATVMLCTTWRVALLALNVMVAKEYLDMLLAHVR